MFRWEKTPGGNWELFVKSVKDGPLGRYLDGGYDYYGCCVWHKESRTTEDGFPWLKTVWRSIATTGVGKHESAAKAKKYIESMVLIDLGERALR